jgi:26S proteasome regulatory subunit T2
MLEEEFINNQERLKPAEDKAQEERSKVDDLRSTPLTVGNLEEIIDDNHAIVSSATGSDMYVPILSIVDKDELVVGSSVLLHHKVRAKLPCDVLASVCHFMTISFLCFYFR